MEQAPVKEAPSIVKQRNLLNRWSIMALMLISASATVLYVNNVLEIKTLLKHKESLKKSADSMRVVNETLKYETYRLQSSERITRIAQERLGLVPPAKAPTIIHSETK